MHYLPSLFFLSEGKRNEERPQEATANMLEYRYVAHLFLPLKTTPPEVALFRDNSTGVVVSDVALIFLYFCVMLSLAMLWILHMSRIGLLLLGYTPLGVSCRLLRRSGRVCQGLFIKD